MNSARLGRISLLLAALGVGLLFSEISLRAVTALNVPLRDLFRGQDLIAAQVEPHGTLGYRQKPMGTYRYSNGTQASSNALGYRGPGVAIPKPPQTFRLVLIGGSTTHGWGVDDDETIDFYMREMLQQLRPLRHVDVINLGFDGYDVLQVYERLRTEWPRFEPDLVVVNAGINDVRNATIPDLVDRDPRTVLYGTTLAQLRDRQLRGGFRAWDRVKHFLYFARLPGIVRGAWTRLGTGQPQAETMKSPQAITLFGSNLRRIAALGETHGAAVLFSTPPSSLNARYHPLDRVRRSYFLVDNATTQAFRDSLSARMRQIAATLAGTGHRVGYVEHPPLRPEDFLDDAHLTPAGNRRVAQDLVEALLPYLDEPAGGERRVRPN